MCAICIIYIGWRIQLCIVQSFSSVWFFFWAHPSLALSGEDLKAAALAITPGLPFPFVWATGMSLAAAVPFTEEVERLLMKWLQSVGAGGGGNRVGASPQSDVLEKNALRWIKSSGTWIDLTNTVWVKSPTDVLQGCVLFSSLFFPHLKNAPTKRGD